MVDVSKKCFFFFYFYSTAIGSLNRPHKSGFSAEHSSEFRSRWYTRARKNKTLAKLKKKRSVFGLLGKAKPRAFVFECGWRWYRSIYIYIGYIKCGTFCRDFSPGDMAKCSYSIFHGTRKFGALEARASLRSWRAGEKARSLLSSPPRGRTAAAAAACARATRR